MAGFKEANTAFALTLQPTPGQYNEPTTADLLGIYSPDNGSEAITGEDATLTGSVWNAPRIFLGRRGRAGATAALRGPGGSAPPGAGAFVLGRILQMAGFTEVINSAAITGTAAGGSTTSIQLAAAAPATDDFYMGYPIQHPNIGSGRARSTAAIRDYIGASKTAVLAETLGTAVAGGTYTIPIFLGYILSIGASIPLGSAKVWRHRKAYRYRDCALNSFAINIPTGNEQNTELPSIEFAMTGVPVQSVDEIAPPLPSSLLTPPPAARAGKFAFAGLKIGSQSMRLEFGIETGAPPNVNFDAGQEGYEFMSGTRTVNVDLNEQLVAQLDVDSLTDQQTLVPITECWGANPGQTMIASVHNALLDAFSPTGRNGFVGIQGGAVPADVDRAMALSFIY
jgi:hypothetical protein